MEITEKFYAEQETLTNKYILPIDDADACLKAVVKFPGLNFREIDVYSWDYYHEFDGETKSYESFEEPDLTEDFKKKKVLAFYYKDTLIQESDFYPGGIYVRPIETLGRGLKNKFFRYCWYQSNMCDTMKMTSTSKLKEVVDLIEYIHFLDYFEEKRIMNREEFRQFCDREQDVFVLRVRLADRDLDKAVFGKFTSYGK